MPFFSFFFLSLQLPQALNYIPSPPPPHTHTHVGDALEVLVGFDNGEVILLDAIGMTQLAKFNSGGTLNAGTTLSKVYSL
jgi:hypothetical protein